MDGPIILLIVLVLIVLGALAFFRVGWAIRALKKARLIAFVWVGAVAAVAAYRAYEYWG